MTRQSISFTDPNAKWLRSKVGVKGEYKSNSEIINDLIRKARDREAGMEAIRAALIEGEESGFSDRTPEDVKKAVVKRLRKNGQLPAD